MKERYSKGFEINEQKRNTSYLLYTKGRSTPFCYERQYKHRFKTIGDKSACHIGIFSLMYRTIRR